jgi:crossover junction endodeoxyribonuclease RuvC
MLILGIDPGLAATGFGLIQAGDQGQYQCVDYGVITTAAGISDADRLKILFAELTELINQHQPQSSAVEKLYFQKNVKTALSVGQARGVTLLTLAQAGLPVFEYNPNEVKQTVCGYGNADKIQVQHMVKTLLNLKELPKPDDAADALAIAICHVHHQAFNDAVQRSQHP